MSARASVLSLSRKVKVRRDARFCPSDVKRMRLHELGVHARRADMGSQAPLTIFTMGVAGYLETEEGLAAYNEYRHGLTQGLRLFALRVLAVDSARRASFSTVFNLLRQYGVDDDMAWAITLRAKRGMADTSRPGAYTKDTVYLRGFLRIRDYVNAGGSWPELVQYGKVSLDTLPYLRRLTGQ